MKELIPYNADEDGCAKTILAGCYKFGSATLLRQTGSTMTSVIERNTPHERKLYRTKNMHHGRP